MDFLLGVVLGVSILYIFRLMYNITIHYISMIQSLDYFLNLDYNNYIFVGRSMDQVRIGLFVNDNKQLTYLFSINIPNKEINIFQNINDNMKLVIYTDKYNKKKIKYLYDELIKVFNEQIFVNVTEINGFIFSNNILESQNKLNSELNPNEYGKMFDTYDKIPTLDDILDKISENGHEYLTQQELDILKKFSDQ